MNVVTLQRKWYTPQGTFGRLIFGGWSSWTLEEVWKTNQRGASCIPVGTYRLQPAIHHLSTPDPNDDYPCLEVVDVPGRTAIHIHYGNTVLDTEGCILPGRTVGTYKDRWAVLQSKAAFGELMDRVAHLDDLWIAIGNVAPTEGVL